MTTKELKAKETIERFSGTYLFIVDYIGNDSDGNSERNTFNIRGKDAFDVWEQILEKDHQGNVDESERQGDGTELHIQGNDYEWSFDYDIIRADNTTESQLEGFVLFEQLKEYLQGGDCNITGPILSHQEQASMEISFGEKFNPKQTFKLLWDGKEKKMRYSIEMKISGRIPSTPRSFGERLRSLIKYTENHLQ